MHDRFKKKFQAPPANARLRHQIALEAARRMFETLGPSEGDPLDRLGDATEGE